MGFGISAQIRAARALLRWSAEDLARESTLGVTTIRLSQMILPQGYLVSAGRLIWSAAAAHVSKTAQYRGGSVHARATPGNRPENSACTRKGNKMRLLKEQNAHSFDALWDDHVRGPPRAATPSQNRNVPACRHGDRVMARHIEDLSQFLQSFGVAALALLFLPALIAALARNVALALTASLLSFTSLMLFIAPTSATSGLAIVSGLGSFLVALESVIARRRMMAFDKQLADLTSRVNQLENAEQRRLAAEVKRRARK